MAPWQYWQADRLLGPLEKQITLDADGLANGAGRRDEDYTR
jgi:hypothetical protein